MTAARELEPTFSLASLTTGQLTAGTMLLLTYDVQTANLAITVIGGCFGPGLLQTAQVISRFYF